MSLVSKKAPLGKGLDALLGPSSKKGSNDNVAGVLDMPIDSLVPGKYQPRKIFNDVSMANLTQSIRSNGIIQPIIVRKLDGINNNYEIIAGERRWRAAKNAGLKTVPVVVKEITNKQTLETGIVENVQRDDLKPLEEAEGYRRLIDEFGYTQEKLAQTVGKSRSYVANIIRLLTLSPKVKQLLNEGKITFGHARCLIGLDNADELVDKIIANGLNVRQTENLVCKILDKDGEEKPRARTSGSVSKESLSNSDVAIMEEKISESLGLDVNIKTNGSSGEVKIKFKNMEEFDRILNVLS